MSIAIGTIREKLIEYIEHVEGRKVKAFYTIVQTDMESENIYTHEFKSELDNWTYARL